MKILVIDDEPTWIELYCRWMGGAPPPKRVRYKVMSISQLKQWLNRTRL